MMLATIAWTASRSSALDAPPAPWNIDGLFYDNLAVQINRGQGFSVDFAVPRWCKVYEQANRQPPFKDQYAWVTQYRGQGPTTMRSPGYPLLLAGVYRLFGYQHAMARLTGCVMVSMALAMLATWIAQRWGVVACVVFCATISADYSVMQVAGQIASESLAILLLTCVFLAVMKTVEQPTRSGCLFSGILFAALMLTRGNWNLGLLILLCLAGLFLVPAVAERLIPLNWGHAVTFFLAVFVVAMPWWIRNCTLTGQFSPFGSAGTCGLVAAWCDQSLADHGQWQPQVFNDLQRAVVDSMKATGDELVPREVEMGRRSSKAAIAWCKSHRDRIPEMMFWRALSHWGFFNSTVPVVYRWLNVAMVVAGFTGCFLFTGRQRGLFAVVLLVDLAIVMLTWEHLGRYAIPIRPLVHLGLALTVCHFWAGVLGKYKLSRWIMPDLVEAQQGDYRDGQNYDGQHDSTRL